MGFCETSPNARAFSYGKTHDSSTAAVVQGGAVGVVVPTYATVV